MANGHAIRRNGSWAPFLGSPGPNPVGTTPPTAAFTSSLGSDLVTESLNASTSTAGSNPISSYSWSFGDGASGTGRTASHTYAATSSTQTFNVTLTVTDSAGYTGSVSHAVSIPATVVTPPPPPSGTSIKNPWTLGTWDEGFPSGVTVYKASSLAPAGWSGDLQTLVNAMPGDGVIDISGEAITITKWPSNYAVTSSHLLGLLGGISGGAFNNSVKLMPNLLSSTQITAIKTQNRYSTTIYRVLATKGALASAVPGSNSYFMGVHFIGADQGPSTAEAPANGDNGAQQKTGPVRHGGLNLDLGGTGSIFQNCLVEGLGYSDGSVPPWEVGSVDYRRSQNYMMRRVEVSGILPVGSASRPSSSTADPYGLGWQRTGGIQWNADSAFQMVDVSLHDTLVSGLTMSIASSSNAQSGGGTNNSRDFRCTRLYIENNSQHGFSGINNEAVEGPVIYDHPTIKMNGTGGYHIKIANNTSFGELAPNIADYEVIEPTWSQTGNPRNGMFTIAISGWPSGNQTTAPKVTVGGKVLTPTTSTTADPANFYCIVKV